MTENKKTLLNGIILPSDLRKLGIAELPQVSEELREFIIREVANNPSHLGSSLGVIELTIALHYAYNTPYDRIVWDVGHQAYGHKILTGRKEKFHTNRKKGGISGFPKISESEYDSFGVGHSSTSISAGLGLSIAAQVKGEKERKVVAVIGDGSMTGGEAFEGLNNAAITNSDILVVLNDNNMAIDPNVGGITEYLANLTTSEGYNRFKHDVWSALGKMDQLGSGARRFAHKLQTGLKSMLLQQSNFFEGLNFRYFGPIDGHDTEALVKILHDLRKIDGPKLLHVITKKGKGFKPAEENQTQWHAAPGKFDVDTGQVYKDPNAGKKSPPKYQDVFGETIVDLASTNKSIVGITPAMPSGCSLNKMMQVYPDRAFDVGIAEQHAVTFAGGLALEGLTPYCNIYSSFMQRAFDQVIHDVALQKLNVIFCLDRGGLVGADGATHHGVFDLAFMRCIPNMIVTAPMDEIELRNLMYTFQKKKQGTVSIRYPRGKGVHIEWEKPYQLIEVGKGRKLSEGDKVALLTVGPVGNFAQKAVQHYSEKGIKVGHFDMRFIKPLDETLLKEALSEYDTVITIEDGVIQGGFGSAVTEFASDMHASTRIIRLGVPDHFIDHGTQQELYAECGFDVDGIITTIEKYL